MVGSEDVDGTTYMCYNDWPEHKIMTNGDFVQEWDCPVIINRRVIDTPLGVGGTLRNGNVVFLRGYE